LVEDPKVIAKKYLTSHFIVDILAILPLPQVFFPCFVNLH
jgi:cyclic nucleotide gated channel